MFAFAVLMIGGDERLIFRTWPRSLETPASLFGLLRGGFLANHPYVGITVTFVFEIGVVGLDTGDPAALAIVIAVDATEPAALAP